MGGAGGAIANFGTATVTGSVFNKNNANDGGGIWNTGALTIANSTFIANVATNIGGAIGSQGENAALTMINSTLVGNAASPGNGGNIAVISAGRAVLRNTIIAQGGQGGNCLGILTDGGHNLEDGITCGLTDGSLSATDPQLDSTRLQDNGGPTLTVALCMAAGVPSPACTAASPAIDAGDTAICAAAPVNNIDQSGFTRPGIGHTHCSIGAYEADMVTPGTCVGDCDHDARVLVDELLKGVNIALGAAMVDQCATFDCNGEEQVTADCLTKGVNNALDGCSVPVCVTARQPQAATLRCPSDPRSGRRESLQPSISRATGRRKDRVVHSRWDLATLPILRKSSPKRVSVLPPAVCAPRSRFQKCKRRG